MKCESRIVELLAQLLHTSAQVLGRSSTSSCDKEMVREKGLKVNSEHFEEIQNLEEKVVTQTHWIFFIIRYTIQ